MILKASTRWARSVRRSLRGIAMMSLAITAAEAQQSAQLQQQVEQLKQEYEATTQALSLRIAILEQQIQTERGAPAENKAGTISVAELAAQQATQAVMGNSVQVGAKFQGQIPSEPTYDLLAKRTKRSRSCRNRLAPLNSTGISDPAMDSTARAGSKLHFKHPVRRPNTASGMRRKPTGNSSLSTIGLIQIKAATRRG